jgi:preprotein translocase subunit SecG
MPVRLPYEQLTVNHLLLTGIWRIDLLAYLFYGLFILACVVLVVTVLLQPGKADAGALFSSSVSSTAFGPRGTQTLLSKITIGAAAGFMLFALILSLPAITGTTSVLQSGVPEQVPVATPTPAATPQVTPAAAAVPSASPAVSPQPSKAPAKKK